MPAIDWSLSNDCRYSSASEDELAKLAVFGRERYFPPGQEVFHHGDYPEYVVLVIDGMVAICIQIDEFCIKNDGFCICNADFEYKRPAQGAGHRPSRVCSWDLVSNEARVHVSDALGGFGPFLHILKTKILQ